MSISEIRAKELAYSRFIKELDFIRKKPKCRDYGNNYTLETIWDKLPEVSRQYWLERVV